MTEVNGYRFEPINIQMEVSVSIIQSALAPLELKNLVAKIVTLTVYPFILIAAFEAIVINGTRVILNFGIFLLNSAHGCLFPSDFTPAEMEEPSPEDPTSIALPLNDSTYEEIEMDPPGMVERSKVEFIVKTLAHESLLDIWGKEATLVTYGEEIEHIHPFQFLEAIFGEFSLVKNDMPTLMKRSIIPGKFLGGLKKSMKLSDHKDKVALYLPSFAKKMNSTLEKVKSFLVPTQKWEGLVMYLIERNCSQIKS